MGGKRISLVVVVLVFAVIGGGGVSGVMGEEVSVSVNVNMNMNNVKGAKCSTIIDNRGCLVEDCISNCRASFRGIGSCIRTTLYTVPVCNCTYDCSTTTTTTT